MNRTKRTINLIKINYIHKLCDLHHYIYRFGHLRDTKIRYLKDIKLSIQWSLGLTPTDLRVSASLGLYRQQEPVLES